MATDKKGGIDVIDRPPEKKRKPPKPPRKFKVIYHNDDFTPMEFVSWSLMTFFNKSEPEANSITLEVHKLGAAVAGIYDYQIAEQKVYEVMELAKENDYPLKITGEPTE
jgi:ATP-dependent Clp protease adaptor protein ClpS